MEFGKQIERSPLVIIGAGPQGLTLATHLLQKQKDCHRQFRVVDPSGGWLSEWKQRFHGLEIPYLRSPAVHHPDPYASELRRFAEDRGNELYDPYSRPGAKLFQDFCQSVVKRWQLESCVHGDQVVHLQYRRGLGRYPFLLELNQGNPIQARRVVLATGAGPQRQPDWVKQIQSPYPEDRLCHSESISLQKQAIAGQTILIVGSGLTSAHLAVGAAKRGAQVIMMARRRFYDRIFDADPGWLGPKYLKQFDQESCWEKRYQMIQAARDGGSVTPELMFKLRRLERQGQLKFYEQCEVESANWHGKHWQGEHWQIHCRTSEEHLCLNHLPIHRIWLATGTENSLRSHPLLQEVQERFPVKWVQGLPILDEHLRWPGCELFIMGAGAALRLGPVARNLAGARMASERIVPALTKSSLALRVASV